MKYDNLLLNVEVKKLDPLSKYVNDDEPFIILDSCENRCLPDI